MHRDYAHINRNISNSCSSKNILKPLHFTRLTIVDSGNVEKLRLPTAPKSSRTLEMDSSFNAPQNEADDVLESEKTDFPSNPDHNTVGVEPGYATVPPRVPEDAPTTLTNGSEFLPISPKQITLDRIIGLIVSAFVIVGGVIGLAVYFFSIENLDWIFWTITAASAAAMGLLVILSFIWPPIEVRNIFWKLESTGLEIRRGVFWKHQISHPLFTRSAHRRFAGALSTKFWTKHSHRSYRGNRQCVG